MSSQSTWLFLVSEKQLQPQPSVEVRLHPSAASPPVPSASAWEPQPTCRCQTLAHTVLFLTLFWDPLSVDIKWAEDWHWLWLPKEILPFGFSKPPTRPFSRMSKSLRARKMAVLHFPYFPIFCQAEVRRVKMTWAALKMKAVLKAESLDSHLVSVGVAQALGFKLCL